METVTLATALPLVIADRFDLERIAGDGTLGAALAEIAATEPELAG